MKINFIIPATKLCGGIKIVFEYANRLTEKGHDVVCYVPMVSYKLNSSGIRGKIKRIKSSIANTFIRGNQVKWFDLKVPIKLVPIINNFFVRDANVVIATAWRTAFTVANLDVSKGNKFYFIQCYEIWNGIREDVNKSYMLQLNRIVISKWLQDILIKDLNVRIHSIVPNAIEFKEFHNDNKIASVNKVVLLMYHEAPHKGYNDGIKAFEIARNKFPNIKLKIFGLNPSKIIPQYAEYYENPSKEKLRDLYSASDIYMFTSRGEGWGLTACEAMACKCAVVGTNVGCLSEIGVNRQTAMLCEPKDIDAMAENLIMLLQDENLLNQVSIGGYRKIKEYTWEKSVNEFEKAIVKISI